MEYKNWQCTLFNLDSQKLLVFVFDLWLTTRTYAYVGLHFLQAFLFSFFLYLIPPFFDYCIFSYYIIFCGIVTQTSLWPLKLVSTRAVAFIYKHQLERFHPYFGQEVQILRGLHPEAISEIVESAHQLVFHNGRCERATSLSLYYPPSAQA